MQFRNVTDRRMDGQTEFLYQYHASALTRTPDSVVLAVVFGDISHVITSRTSFSHFLTLVDVVLLTPLTSQLQCLSVGLVGYMVYNT